jgi:D-alanyl-D-alanine carboxypeptidase/D-alanyl-D-alanine-endopeptidase (penicillin-binding protein 4)
MIRFSRLGAAVLLAALGAAVQVHAQAQAPVFVDGATDANTALPSAVSSLMQANGIADNELGVIVLRGDHVLLSHGAALPMRPASTIKLLTSMVALEQLGPVFRGRTELRSSADLIDGTLTGDLILRGGADADFSEDALRHMLEALRRQGIRKIRGDLLVDRQLFQPARPDLGLPPFDSSPEAHYNVIPDALLLNTNMLRIDLSSTARQVKLVMSPALEGVGIVSEMTMIDGDCAKWEDGWKLPEARRSAGGALQVVLHGTFPRNCVAANNINVLDRADYTDRLFRATWRQLGGVFSGQVRELSAPAPAPVVAERLLAAHTARVLPEVMRDMNKWSDNTLARLLFLSLGSLEADPLLGSRPLPAEVTSVADMAAPTAIQLTPLTTAARSEQQIRAWLQRHHIDDSGIVLENGSGLSRRERIAPLQLAAVLQVANGSLWAPEFLTSLPIAAVDGTMRKRLVDSPAAQRARVKTGTLDGVIANAGYVPDAAGQPCIVVAFVNSDHAGHGAGRAVLDALMDWVARQ